MNDVAKPTITNRQKQWIIAKMAFRQMEAMKLSEDDLMELEDAFCQAIGLSEQDIFEEIDAHWD